MFKKRLPILVLAALAIAINFNLVSADDLLGTTSATVDVSATPAPTDAAIAAATAPTVPNAIDASTIKFAPGNQSLIVSWIAPSDGGSAITDYEISYSTDSGASKTWTAFSHTASTDTSIDITGLTNPTPGSVTDGYFVRVRAVNAVGNATWSESTTSSTTVPGTNGNRAISGDPGCVTNSLYRNDDASVGNVALGFDVNWYGTIYNKVAYNNNGGVKFNSSSWGQYSGLDLSSFSNDPLIVALFNDLDTRQSNTTIGTYGPLTYPINGHTGYCFNWVNYGDYPNGAPSKSAQLIILSKANNDVDLIMNYNWLASGSSRVITGWAAPGGQGYIFQSPIPASNTAGQQGTGAGSLVEQKNIPTNYSSLDNKGRYIFELEGGSVQGAPGAPTAPQNVSHSGVGNGAVTLTWDAPTSDGGNAITNYTIQYSLDGISGWTNYNHTRSTDTSLRVTGLTNGTQYFFRVTAFSNVSGEASSVVGPITPVAAPENSVAPSFTGTQGFGQTLSGLPGTWNDGGSAVTGTTYQWQVSINCTGTYTNISGATSANYRIDRSAIGGCVRLAVTTTNANGSNVAYSDYSSRIVVVAPDEPGTPKTTSIGQGAISLDWTSPSSDGGADITSYDLQYSTDGINWTDYPTSFTGKVATISGLTNGTGYYVRIRATNGTAGAWSAAGGPFTPVVAATPTPSPSATRRTRVTASATPTPSISAYVPAPLNLTQLQTEKVTGVVSNTTDPTKPITVAAGEIPLGIPGNAIMLVNGAPVQIKLNQIDVNTLQAVSTDGLVFNVKMNAATGTSANVINGSLVVEPGHSLAINGSGFESNSEVTIWIFSDPKKLATVPVAADGSISADVAVALGLAPGEHTLQVSGYHPDGTTRSVTLSVVVPDANGNIATPSANASGLKVDDGGNLLVRGGFGLAIAFVLWLSYMLIGKRRKPEQEVIESFNLDEWLKGIQEEEANQPAKKPTKK